LISKSKAIFFTKVVILGDKDYMRILIMGGTRFIGVSLTRILLEQGHEVVLFNRGNRPAPFEDVREIHGDRSDQSQLKEKLASEKFDVIFDNNGRELSDTQPLVEIFKDQAPHFVYVSSAGVYQKSNLMPHIEGDVLDPKSRHKGKFHTEDYLASSGIPWTSVRPVYIYGPGNYNDLEAWFFDRLVRGKPIPIPENGLHITQLGHVDDLAKAMSRIIQTPASIGQIYNISGSRYVTFDGLAQVCSQAVGMSLSELKIVHYHPKNFDFGKKKAFPLRAQHFFADISKASKELDWKPEFDLLSGLKDSFSKDYQNSQRAKIEIDFSVDEQIIRGLG
jgi:nucleoside-diphosphate-sugar epimerase